MTTIATEPLDHTRISKPKSRPAEIAHTLEERFDLPSRAAPGNLTALVELVEQAIEDGVELRAIGSGRGMSAATDPVGTRTVSTENLKKIYTRHGRDIRGLRRRREVGLRSICRVQCGTPARTVLRALTSEQRPRTLINHGSGDFQSIVGAISTGTHGTGPFPSLAGLVRAIVVVRVDATGPKPVPRVELIQRSKGATGEQLPCYRVPKSGVWKGENGIPVHAVNDDDRFFAHVVGLGCLGLVYCMTLDILEEVPLMDESRVPMRLDRIFAKAQAEFPARCEFIIDPYPRVTTGSDNPKRWDDLAPFPAHRDWTFFRGQYVDRVPSDAPGPKGSLPLSMQMGSQPTAATLIGGRIGEMLEDPTKHMPAGAESMIQCSSTDSYIDWLPDVLLLNLKYTGQGAEWAIPWDNLEDALWILLEDAWKTYQLFAAKSDDRGRWTGTEDELLALLRERTPMYNGPAVRFVLGEGALLAGTHRRGPSGDVPIWTTVEVGFLGRPDVEDAWRPRKRHAGIRPEQPVPAHLVDQLLGELDAADAASPGGAATWMPAENLKRIRGKGKQRRMRLFAAYEAGRFATLDRLTEALCTPAIGARPHQGLHNSMTWADVERFWGDAADRWRTVFETVNPTGTFDGPLTRQWGVRASITDGVS